MKITESKRIVILSDLSSRYFTQGIFVLRENVMIEEERLLNEAREIAEKYAKRCEKSRALVKTDRKRIIMSFLFLLAGILSGGTAVLLCV